MKRSEMPEGSLFRVGRVLLCSISRRTAKQLGYQRENAMGYSINFDTGSLNYASDEDRRAVIGWGDHPWLV